MQRWWCMERSWLLLTLLSPAYVRPQYIAPMQWVEAGPYYVYNCGTHTSDVSLLISTLISTLEPVLDDLSRNESSDAFIAFFKHIAFAPSAYDILLNIATGAPTTPGPHAMRGASSDLFGPAVTPQLVCVTDYNQVTWSTAAGGRGGKQTDAYTVCQQSPVNSFGLFGSKYLKNSIVLCPAFWKYPALPSPSKANCLKVDPHFNRFRDAGKRLVNYQLWVILHELAHVYIYGRSGSLAEVSSANDCFLLAGGSCLDNAQNFVFYVANIRLGCTNFPSGSRPNYSGSGYIRGGSVELLEIDANTTLIGGSKSQNGSINGGQVIANSSTSPNEDLPNSVTPAQWPT